MHRWLLLNRVRMGHIATEFLPERLCVVRINLGVIVSTRDGDIGQPLRVTDKLLIGHPCSAPRFVIFEAVPRHTRLLLLDLVHDPVEPLLRHCLALRQRTQQVHQQQPARRDFHHLRTESKPRLVLFDLAQDQPADQLRLRLVPLRRQPLQFVQLRLVQLCPHVMHPEPRPLCRFRRKVLLIEQRHRSNLPAPAFTQGVTGFLTEPPPTLSIRCQDGSSRKMSSFPTVSSKGWSVKILPVRSTAHFTARHTPSPTHSTDGPLPAPASRGDRKSTRLNSSHVKISYAVFCLKKKK